MRKYQLKLSGLSSTFFFILTAFNSANAQAANPDYPENYYQYVIYFFLFVLLLIVAGFFYFGTEEKSAEEESIRKDKKETLFRKISQFLTRSTPVEKEEEILLEGHDYDGIRELDNRIPPWFSWLFYVTIIFSVYYMIDYHVLHTSPLQEEEYQIEVRNAELKRAELEKSGALITEETVEALTDQVSIENGRQIFQTNCVACHAADGGGLVGPNLTDDYWIHGGGIKNIFKVIKYGVPAKGMISWQTQLNPKQIQEVASYILTLRGTQPAAPKQPEGNLWQADSDSVTVN
ncbi:MAG: hypothetical protein Kow0098_11350 [Ignavibacteriaceae bacterium]